MISNPLFDKWYIHQPIIIILIVIITTCTPVTANPDPPHINPNNLTSKIIPSCLTNLPELRRKHNTTSRNSTKWNPLISPSSPPSSEFSPRKPENNLRKWLRPPRTAVLTTNISQTRMNLPTTSAKKWLHTVANWPRSSRSISYLLDPPLLQKWTFHPRR